MKSIKEKIEKETSHIKDLYQRKKIQALCLYSVLNMPYFKDTYNTINVAETSEKELPFILISESLNNIKGFTNQRAEDLKIGLNKDDQYETQFIEKNEILKYYIGKEKKESINKLSKILIKSQNFEEFVNNVKVAHEENENFLHHCFNLNRRGYYNKYSKLFKLIESSMQYGRIESSKLKSRIYTMESKGNRGVFSSLNKSSFFDESKIYEDVIKNNFLSWLVREKNPMKYILEEGVANNFMEKRNPTKKEIKDYIKNNPDSDISLFLKESNEEKRVSKILNKHWKTLQENFKELLKDLRSFKNIDVEILENKDEIDKVIKNIGALRYNNLPTDNVTLTIVETEYNKGSSMSWSQTEQRILNEKEYKESYENIEYLNLINYKKDINLNNLFHNEKLNLFTYENQNENFAGLGFLNNELFLAQGKTTYLLLRNEDDETIGFLSIYNNNPKNTKIKNIGNIELKYNYRGLNLTEKLYDGLAKLSMEKGWIITNSMYTEQGKERLPEIKERVREKYPKFLMIDTDYKIKKNERCHGVIESFNREVISYVSSIDEKDFNIEKINKEYKKVLNKIYNMKDKEIESYKYNYDKNKALFEDFKEKIDKKYIKSSKNML